jgi:hypothetical protein
MLDEVDSFARHMTQNPLAHKEKLRLKREMSHVKVKVGKFMVREEFLSREYPFGLRSGWCIVTRLLQLLGQFLKLPNLSQVLITICKICDDFGRTIGLLQCEVGASRKATKSSNVSSKRRITNEIAVDHLNR